MFKSGIVIQVDHKTQTGVIEAKNGTEFFFSASECEGGELPAIHSVVTFIKDQDFKSTNVASLVKVSETYLRLAGRYVKAA
jgi:hypothetical protein